MTDGIDITVKVAVIGAGTMGSGIAHVAAKAGHAVYLYDTLPEAVDRGVAAIGRDLEFLVGKGRLSRQDADLALARVHPVTTLEALADAGLVIEAIVEDRDTKHGLLTALETIVAPACILASNTSSISITDLARGLRHPERVAGLHFFNPPPRMALVEVVRGLGTEPAVIERLVALSKAWGKTPVVATSTPGFVVNRVARPFYGEAMRTLTERACDPATLDAVMRDCGGFAMGPCELVDLIGLDVNLAVTRSVFEATGFDRRYAPWFLQQELVRAGRHGRKTGHGFFAYGEGTTKPDPAVEPLATGMKIVTVSFEHGLLESLVTRLHEAGVQVRRVFEKGPQHLQIGDARLELSDGRTATRRAADEGDPDIVLIDLVLDPVKTGRVAVARSDACSTKAWNEAVGTLQRTGLQVTQVDDVAGMLVLRTVAMLINEAADLVGRGVATPTDVDTAMALGMSFPIGPLAWCDRLGAGFVAGVLDNLFEHYGEERYRVSPALQRRRWSGAKFHG